MEEFWSLFEANNVLAKNKKKKNKDKSNKNPYIDPIHQYTDDPGAWWNVNPDDVKTFGKCAECNKYAIGVKAEDSQGLCDECRSDSNIVKKHTKNCGYCGNAITDSAKYPEETMCKEHRNPCQSCGRTIDDLGGKDNWGNEVTEDSEQFCKNCRKACSVCHKKIDDQIEEPNSNQCDYHRKYCEDCGISIDDIGENDPRYPYGVVEENEDRCDSHRHFCEYCNERIEDQDDNPYSTLCEHHRKYCEKCEEEILDHPDESDYCSNCRNHCAYCGDVISDQYNFPDSDYCEYHRKYCKECGGEMRDYDYDYSDDSKYCYDCRKECKECNDEIDIDEFPESSYCEEHLPLCKECDDYITDTSIYPHSEKCDDCRKYCAKIPCYHEADTQPEWDKEDEGKTDPNSGEPLTNFCDLHRHPCKVCNSPVYDYHKLKNEEKALSKPNVPVEKAQEIGTNPYDLSSMQYLDAINPEYYKTEKTKPLKIYNVCNSCRDYINYDWKNKK
jgi:hypothetical protein